MNYITYKCIIKYYSSNTLLLLILKVCPLQCLITLIKLVGSSYYRYYTNLTIDIKRTAFNFVFKYGYSNLHFLIQPMGGHGPKAPPGYATVHAYYSDLLGVKTQLVRVNSAADATTRLLPFTCE